MGKKRRTSKKKNDNSDDGGTYSKVKNYSKEHMIRFLYTTVTSVFAGILYEAVTNRTTLNLSTVDIVRLLVSNLIGVLIGNNLTMLICDKLFGGHSGYDQIAILGNIINTLGLIKYAYDYIDMMKKMAEQI